MSHLDAPTNATASITDILPSAAALLGLTAGEDRLSLLDSHGPTDTVVVLLIDGLGLHLLEALAPSAPLLADVLRGARGQLVGLESTFPSTTPTSLVSLGTGSAPGEHGVLGFTLRVPETGALLTHVLWRTEPDPRTWQPRDTWFERVAAVGVGARAVLPAAFAGSGLTDAAYRGAAFRWVQPAADYAVALAAEIGAGPGLVYGYLADLDTAAHLHGAGSAQWHTAAAAVDALVRRVVSELPAGAVLLVTADHGGLNVPPDARWDIDSDPRLGDNVLAATGEPRVRYLHVRPGAIDDVAAAWRSVLNSNADVLLRDEAIDGGLFGPVSDSHRQRLGDLIVVCTADVALLATAHEPPEVSALVGFHGSRTAVEMAIPLITLTREDAFGVHA
ncbi:alkaline phosphatase family protein [uncultured Jatrophihabitans sp.]|uniref:alkaline phosphatase family protein n=1 Tax=uncultured Jatrophihabitans sp. TaxID=1610747 RepID=UPI0035CB7438